MRRAVAILALLFLPAPSSAQGRFAQALTIGRVDSMQSAVLREMRPYLVYTPPSYDDTTATPHRYPVLYLLDGDAHFHSVSGLIQILGTGVNGTYVVPEMIVVAIPNTDRTRDLTPTHTEAGPDGTASPALRSSGGGPAFLRFIETELIPRIEAQYRTMPYRVYVGHSLGGITSLFALYTAPHLFDAYVAIDPSLWWDNQTLLRRAREFFSTARLEGKTLYLAQANTISPDDTTSNTHSESILQFNAIMQSYDESGIRFAYRYYGDDSHGSVPLIAEYDALRFIFDGYSVPLLQVIDQPALLTRHFDRVSERLGRKFTPSEGMVRQLARIALMRDTANAIRLGEIWRDLYPESFRSYEFLGDVHAARNEPQRARSWYEQSLAKSPSNSRVREKIDRLNAGG